MAGPSRSSYESLPESRFGEWESTLKNVTNEGYASSEETWNTNRVEIFAAQGKIWYREHDDVVYRIKKLGDVPGKSMHFRNAARADYAEANSLETARVEALTEAIYSGSIKITGRYACVSHIGTYPTDSAPKLWADTPIPIKLCYGQEVKAITDYHKVIVVKKVTKMIHVCHIKPEYSPSDRAQQLSRNRIYFAGVLP